MPHQPTPAQASVALVDGVALFLGLVPPDLPAVASFSLLPPGRLVLGIKCPLPGHHGTTALAVAFSAAQVTTALAPPHFSVTMMAEGIAPPA